MIRNISCIAVFLALFLASGFARAENVAIKVRAINPLDEKAPVVIHYPLPAGLTPDDIIAKNIIRGKGSPRKGNFQIKFDEKENLYFIDHQITLGPKEIITLEVEAKDVWTISPQVIEDLRNQAQILLQSQPVSEEAGPDPVVVNLKEEIFRQVDEVARTQQENTIAQVGVEAHMKAYQKSREILQQVQMDIAMLENVIGSLAAEAGEQPPVGEDQTQLRPQPEAVPAVEIPAPSAETTSENTAVSVPAQEPAPPEEPSLVDKFKSWFKRK